jgi:hypothetical protein
VRELLPGVVVAAVLLVVLQQLGSLIVRHFITGASDTYGTFGTVIALLSWFFLLSRLLLLSAQLNVVLADDLSPRSLLPASPVTDADRRASLLDVQRVRRDRRLAYAVAVNGVAGDGSTGDVEVTGEAADLEQALDGGARRPQQEP